MELIAAMVCSGVLLAGLGSVMLIGRQVAYSPSAASVRTETANVVSHLADELQYATLLIGQSTRSLEFVIADRDGDGRAEKIRYAWSGTSGDPLIKTVNGGTPKTVLEAVEEFNASYVLKPETMTLNTTSDTAEAVLLSNDNVQSGIGSRHHDDSPFGAANQRRGTEWRPGERHLLERHQGAIPGPRQQQRRRNVARATPLDGRHVRRTDERGPRPNKHSRSLRLEAWVGRTKFDTPVRGLALHRKYALVWAGVGGDAARFLYTDSTPSGVFESNDGGATWQLHEHAADVLPLAWHVHAARHEPRSHAGTYVSHVQLTLQSGGQSHARVDTSVPLVNLPGELSCVLANRLRPRPHEHRLEWRRIHRLGNGRRGASFDSAKLIGGVWHAIGALETRPLNDFTKTTIVEVRCRNTSVGGNGAVVQISADRQSGLHAPLTVIVKLQADGTQTLTLLGKTSDSSSVTLFSYPRLSNDFVSFRLTIVPHLDLVNVHINDEDQGTYTYPVYVPSTRDRYVTLYADASLAEFDYVDVRVTEN